MADSKSGLRKPVFTKVDQLCPGTSGHTLTVKVVNAKMVMQRGRSDGPQSRQMRIAECLVGDETGMIIYTARNDQDYAASQLSSQGRRFCLRSNIFAGSTWNSMSSAKARGKVGTNCVDTMTEGATVILRNAKIDMFKGSMRLAVDKWGRVEVTEPASFTVKEDNNLSLIEYELVNVVAE
ncbi:Hypothetical protein glysoja_000024 [Glycine soja]|nr:Hypothetical protein glysoja_000024 [Glycine soja]